MAIKQKTAKGVQKLSVNSCVKLRQTAPNGVRSRQLPWRYDDDDCRFVKSGEKTTQK